jgi:glycosyltransferase involved in cell wall biosynthesis
MRVLILSDHEFAGGAAMMGTRLSEALAERGHDVHRVVCKPGSGPRSWRVYNIHRRNVCGLPYKLLRPLLPEPQAEPYERRCVEQAFARIIDRVAPDVIDVHNIHAGRRAGWTDGLVRIAADLAPCCWTLHDMWSFTGRCAYSGDCRRYVTGCDSTCPTPGEYPPLAPELIEPAWLARRALLASRPAIAGIAVSRWVRSAAIEGLWRDHRVEVIHNAVPVQRYIAHPRAVARDRLSIDAASPVLLAVAYDWSSPHKGGPHLVDAMRRLARRRPTLLTLGKSAPPPIDGVRTIALGTHNDESFKSVAFSAADCFVHPAIHESFGVVLIEALACGTPVAAFPIGGIPEIIRTGINGSLATAVDGAALANAVESILDGPLALEDARASLRAEAESRFDVGRYTDEYLAAYASLRRPTTPG